MSYTTIVGHKRPNLGSVMNGTMDYAESSMGFRPVVGNEGGCMVVKQQFQKKKSTGKAKTKLERMKIAYSMCQNSITARFQGLTLFNTAAATYPLNANYTSATDILTMPMYCFNLTAMPVNGITSGDITQAVTRVVTLPAYRLQKTATTTTLPIYNWTQVSQGHGTSAGNLNTVTGWEIEWDTINGNPPVQVNRYCVDWMKSKFVFKGASKRPIKMHMAFCKFEHPGAGPVRNFFNGAGVVAQESVDQDQFTDGTLYWDHFWSTRVSNPIRTSRKPDNYKLRQPCRMWGHESFVLGEDVSINNDPLPLQATYSRFHRFDKPMKCVNTSIPVTQSKNVVGQNLAAGGAAFGYVSAEKLAGSATGGTGVTQSAYPAYTADTWLLVWADVYDQSTNGAYADGSLQTDVSPSFDINLVCKYSYND